MKIVYSIASIGRSGGTERVICTKANYLADVLDYEIHIIVLRQEETFFRFSPKIQIHALGIDEIQYKGWMIFGNHSKTEYQQKLFQKLEDIKPDITISVFGLDAEFLYKAKDGSKKVLEFHFTKNYLKYLGDSLPNDKYRLLRKLWMKFLLKKESYYASKYEHVVLLTERDKKLWGGIDKFTVIPNPLSFLPKQIASLDNKQVIAVGSFIPQKGFDLLIDAFAIIAKNFPDWRLMIYGDGQDYPILVNKINSLSLQSQVFINSPQKNIAEKFLESSIFAFSSRYEGFGLVLTEAMACGLPCVSFDCECGPDEIIEPNVTGILVPPCNVAFFADALKELITEELLRKQMGNNAVESVVRFYPENIMPQWITFFNQLNVEI